MATQITSGAPAGGLGQRRPIGGGLAGKRQVRRLAIMGFR
jgi:hypothetical protein